MQDPLYSLVKATLDEVSEPIKEFMSGLLGAASNELGMLLADRVRFWRLKQALKIIDEARTLLHQKGINPQKVNLKTLVPILESGSLEDDESMQHRWASLLANAADPTYTPSVPPSFPEILKQLSHKDALVLDRLFDIEFPKFPADRRFRMDNGIWTSELESALNLSHNEIVFALDNLHRLGLCVPPTAAEGELQYAGSDFRLPYYQVYLTAIGATFVTSCRTSPVRT